MLKSSRVVLGLWEVTNYPLEDGNKILGLRMLIFLLL